jgi:protein-tyrosine phosphatase
MIDMHCHILPGIDDGPRTIEESVALARAAMATGTRTIVATPHVSWRYSNSARTIAQLTDDLNTRLAAEGVGLEVRAGAEIAMTRAVEMAPEELRSLRLGGGSWLLIECPFVPIGTGFDSILLELQGLGHRILLAHPERCPAFQRDPAMLSSLVEAGMLTSITAGALVGRFGGEVRRFAHRLALDGMIHNVASDAHDCQRRPPGIVGELEQAGLESLADWLTQAVPTAILNSGEVPPRPPAPPPNEMPRQAWWRRRG